MATIRVSYRGNWKSMPIDPPNARPGKGTPTVETFMMNIHNKIYSFIHERVTQKTAKTEQGNTTIAFNKSR